MKKILLILAIFIFGQLNSQTCNSSSTKIIMVGDSWSWLPWTLYTSIDDNLDKYGFTDLDAYSTQDLSVNGKKTKYLLDTVINNKIKTAVLNNPNANVINLSIGGNDFLRGWDTTMTAFQSDSVLESIINRVDTIIQNIWGIDSTLKVHLPMYDFPNFDEVISPILFPNQHPFYEAWESMEFPTFLQINTQLINIGSKAQALANKYDHVTYVNSAGLMQFIYGQTTALRVAPGGTYAPGTVPFPGGNPNYPSPITSLRDYALGVYDCFHLDEAGYRHFYDNNFKHFYFNHLRSDRDTVCSSEGSNKDGYVNANDLGNNTLAVGNSGINLTSSIISFNTSLVPSNKTVSEGKIFIKRDSLHSAKPINGKVFIEIKTGYFGSSDTLESVDFTDVATAGDTVCVYGTINNNGDFLRIDIPQTLMQYINKTGQTQFRITPIGNSVGFMFFATGDDANYPPQLDMFYSNSTNIKENKIDNNSISVYPNPNSGDILNLSFKETFNGIINVIDMTGKKVDVTFSNNKINISNLPKGYYTIVFNEKNLTTTKRFVRM
jgi:hypothetical protein